ncbi:hypothetical protein [Streptomyces purpureus]|uniref:hypothetical protein n=1 Tax=Streptomyces purpureus TaxID=1951 RepID=UPI0003660412|nr:hypothetical protein [Streptomyces purpureus]
MTENPEPHPEQMDDIDMAVLLAQIALLGVGPGAYESRRPGYAVIDADSKICVRLED